MSLSKPKIGILLAAGSSSRMKGDDKLMQDVFGKPMIRHAAEHLCGSGVDQVIVAIAQDRPEHVDALRGLKVDVVEVPNAQDGMGVSLRTAIDAAPDAGAFVVSLCDMPDITSDHIRAVIAAYQSEIDALIVVPKTTSGVRGHPVVFDGRFRQELLACDGDTGAKHVLHRHADSVVHVLLDDAISRDLDTQEAWDAWRNERVKR